MFSFRRGARRLRPVYPPSFPSWDLSVVLKGLLECFGAGHKGLAASKHTISHWVRDAISLAYEVSYLPSPLDIRAHSTRGVASSTAFTFTFMHLADAFIQSIAFKLQFLHFFLSDLAFPGNRTHDLGVANAMLYQLSYRKAQQHSLEGCP